MVPDNCSINTATEHGHMIPKLHQTFLSHFLSFSFSTTVILRFSLALYCLSLSFKSLPLILSIHLFLFLSLPVSLLFFLLISLSLPLCIISVLISLKLTVYRCFLFVILNYIPQQILLILSWLIICELSAKSRMITIRKSLQIRCVMWKKDFCHKSKQTVQNCSLKQANTVKLQYSITNITAMLKASANSVSVRACACVEKMKDRKNGERERMERGWGG